MRPTRSAHPTRRHLRAAGAGVVALALALAGCSGSDKPAAKKSSTSSTTTATPAPTPSPFQARGLPAGLLAAVKPIYTGGSVPASASAAAALKARKVTPGAHVTAVGSVSSWKGTPIAVVTAGKDVTLAVGPRWRVVGGWWPSLGLPKPVTGAAVRRVLFIGSDARDGENPARTRGDSLHIAAVDGKGAGGIVGIPRDSWVPLASGGHGKINSALVFGGPTAVQRTVESLTGDPVEGYVLTGFAGFYQLVNAVGPVTIVSARSFVDHYSHADIKKGVNQLKGGAALAYARTRHALPDGDFGRSRNQGSLMLAGLQLVRLAGPARLPKLLGAVAPSVQTNLSAEQVLTFAAASAFGVVPSRFVNKVVPGGVGMVAGQSVVTLGAGAHALFADIRDGNLR